MQYPKPVTVQYPKPQEPVVNPAAEQREKQLGEMSVALETAFLKHGEPPKWHVQVRAKDPHNNIAIYSENTQSVRALVFPDKNDAYRVAFYGPIKPSDRDEIEEALKDTGLNVSIMNTPFVNPGGF
jgi:hypothetical protein